MQKISRTILSKLISELENDKVLILLGARQVGKSFLMNELELKLKKASKKFNSYNLEIPKDNRIFARDELELYEEISEGVNYLFIDEFQYYNNASHLFKAFYDDRRKKIKVIASGSSALEMHKHLKESLAGRKKTYIIYPLSFKEAQETKVSFNNYLLYGALAEILNIEQKTDKITALEEIHSTYILKDIKALIKEESISSFNALIYSLAQNQGQIISSNSLANDLRLNTQSLERYLEILEQTYVLYKLSSFSKNLSNELKKSKKYYFYDSGIRNSILNNFSSIEKRKDKGSIYEAYVAQFLTINSIPNSELRFWRTRNGDEIDFVFLKNQVPYLFEVKSKLKRKEIPNAMKIFLRNYREIGGAYIINENLDEELEYSGVTVRFIPINKLEEDLEIAEIFST
ncbi:MAG: ATP-binding protein [Candidatus Caenarcaniphilales bacterium]|nr:ATP-binding protein [Candidatus Caenarcaniphilales bacterium]